MDIETIEKNAQRYAQARSELADVVGRLTAEQEEVKRKHMKPLRAAVQKTQQRRDELRIDVEVAPQLFEKPKSRVLHGIRVGYRKAKGKLTFPDPKKVVAKVKEILPDKSDSLVKTEEKPVRAELNKLDAATLRRLGVEVTADTDVAIVEPTTDTEIDKIVDALVEGEEQAA